MKSQREIIEEPELQTVWYDAKQDAIFQWGYLEGLFCALAFHPDFWKNNPHIELIGIIED